MIPMVSEVLCGMDLDTVNQVLVHWLHFSVGAEEEPGRDISLFSFCWAAAAHYPNFSSIFTACLKDKLCSVFCYAFWGILEGTALSSTQLDRHTKMRSMSCTSCLLHGLLVCGRYIHSNPHHSALSKKRVSLGGYSLLSLLTQMTLHC